MNLPKIKFVELKDRTEKGLIDFITEHREERSFVVYIREKWREEEEWEYHTENCNVFYYNDIGWLIDWNEGQPFVEYLAVTTTEYPEDDE